MKLTTQAIEEALALEDKDAQVQAYATLMRLASEDILENIDALEVEHTTDTSAIVTLPETNIQLVLSPMLEDDVSYTCAIYHNGTFLDGGFTLINPDDAERLDDLLGL